VAIHNERMDLIARPESTISGKIRALDRAGFKRAEIARFLNRKYQHVRNVLEADKQRAAALSNHGETTGFDPGSVPSAKHRGSKVQATFRLQSNPDGSLLIPGYVLKSIAIGRDEVIVASTEQDRITLTSAEASMRRAQELVASLLPGADSLADSLIADRHREIEEERTDG
jgi:hypothetical protein